MLPEERKKETSKIQDPVGYSDRVIRSPSVKPPTHRGVRAGSRKVKHRKIPVQITTSRPDYTTTSHNQRNLTNLTEIPKHSPNHLHAQLWNAQSVRHKTTAITDFVLEKDVDILFLTETWLSQNDPVIIGELTPPGYTFLNIPRLETAYMVVLVCYSKLLFIYKSSQVRSQQRHLNMHA